MTNKENNSSVRDSDSTVLHQPGQDASRGSGKPPDRHDINLSFRILPEHRNFPLRVSPATPLLDVMVAGADRAGVPLLPNAEAPFDQLHNIGKRNEVGPAITDLQQSVEEFLAGQQHTHDFGLELVCTIRVNTRSAVAPKDTMSPRDILGLVELNFQEYTLYKERSATPLPLDTSFAIARGDVFEAQRDGKYGEVV